MAWQQRAILVTRVRPLPCALKICLHVYVCVYVYVYLNAGAGLTASDQAVPVQYVKQCLTTALNVHM